MYMSVCVCVKVCVHVCMLQYNDTLYRSCIGKATIQIDHTATIKILVLGDKGVGKSSLILKYAKDDFDIHETPTVSA